MLFVFSFATSVRAEDKQYLGNGLSVGDKVPEFNLKTETNKLISFNKHFKGKVLLLVVANYCTKDLGGVWTIQSYYKFHKNKDFAFPFVFSRFCVPFYVPNAFVSSQAHYTATTLKIPYFLMDWENNLTVNTFKANSIYSHIYIVDRKGIIRWKHTLTTPFTSPDEMNATIQKLLDSGE